MACTIHLILITIVDATITELFKVHVIVILYA